MSLRSTRAHSERLSVSIARFVGWLLAAILWLGVAFALLAAGGCSLRRVHPTEVVACALAFGWLIRRCSRGYRGDL